MDLALTECKKGIEWTEHLVTGIRTRYTNTTRPPTQEYDALFTGYKSLYNFILTYKAAFAHTNITINQGRAMALTKSVLQLGEQLKQAVSNTIQFNVTTQMNLLEKKNALGSL